MPGYGGPSPSAQALENVAAQGRAVLARLDPTGWRPTITVAAVILALVFGVQIVNAALPVPSGLQNGPGNPSGPGTPSGPGSPIVVGNNNVVVYPRQGWSQLQLPSPQTSVDGLRLQKGAAVFDLRLFTIAGGTQANTGASDLATYYVQAVLGPGASQLQTSTPQQVPVNGVTGVRVTYLGNFNGVQQPIEGQVTAFVRGTQGLVVDGWANQGQLSGAVDDIEQMIQTIEVH